MLQEYLHKHPLTRHIYGREAVEKIRRHALEFEDYLAKVRRFAATELSIFVALPNETEFSYEIPKVKK
jgi:hypothetical protein